MHHAKKFPHDVLLQPGPGMPTAPNSMHVLLSLLPQHQICLTSWCQDSLFCTIAHSPHSSSAAAAAAVDQAIHAAGAKVAGDGTPFRRPLASIRYRAAAEDRSEFTTSGVLENAYKSLEVGSLAIWKNVANMI
jgi:hypothetical protein